MKKIGIIFLIIVFLFLIFSCEEPTESFSFSSSGRDDSVKTEVTYTQTFPVGSTTWFVPENATGSAKVTVIGGGGGGGYSPGLSGTGGAGGGGAGQVITGQIIHVEPFNICFITVGGADGYSRFQSATAYVNASEGQSGGIAPYGAGGAGYPSGANGRYVWGGAGGDNGSGYGRGGNGASCNGSSGDPGGSGYVKIEYTVLE